MTDPKQHTGSLLLSALTPDKRGYLIMILKLKYA